MKKSLATLSLGLLAGLAGNSAFATSGSVLFEGTITPETCPIEIVNPGNGSVNDRVAMGDIPVGRFTAANIEVRGASFDIRVPDKGACSITEDNAYVQFDGAADTSGNYFRVDPVAGAATNVSIVIKDISNTSIAPGGTSVNYPLNATGPTDLRFDAYYRSTATGVQPGLASAKVRYTVAYR
ncbi:fimbrial protein [Pseudomonas kermanshahensis]|uniref:Fimbrial protein n=1 Tax=Pseudomonas kermanshahensis TaxID=2745482 RepID=A0ABU8R9G3_9PSED|nr:MULTISPECIES: fimbrial protein [Pseudomonas]MBC3486273.1 type 1 fimbrial protein [Pseudomonas sp. SWRI50]MBC3498046.1 type 1 fimbrial protein [Pseudomonas sp. SWRI67]MBV4525577.1 type 1 fimbrial protein [Pseudomonas kermanshahensis]